MNLLLEKQILRSGTSIGANIREGVYSISKREFIYKLSISLKEASETEYWLELLFESDIISKEVYDELYSDCLSLIKILSAIIKTSNVN